MTPSSAARTFSAPRCSPAPPDGSHARYLMAAIFSSIPFGHSFASSEAR